MSYYARAALFTCLFGGCFMLATSDSGFFDVSIKDSSPVCVGRICDSSNAFFFYRCCGDILNDCCFRLQQWVVILLVVLGALTLLSFAIGLIKCICCCNRDN